jgi:hypothetical protein
MQRYNLSPTLSFLSLLVLERKRVRLPELCLSGDPHRYLADQIAFSTHTFWKICPLFAALGSSEGGEVFSGSRRP